MGVGVGVDGECEVSKFLVPAPFCRHGQVKNLKYKMDHHPNKVLRNTTWMKRNVTELGQATDSGTTSEVMAS